MDPISVVIDIISQIGRRRHEIIDFYSIFLLIREIIHPNLSLLLGNILSNLICSFILVVLFFIIGLIQIFNSKMLYPLLILIYVIYNWYNKMLGYNIEEMG